MSLSPSLLQSSTSRATSSWSRSRSVSSAARGLEWVCGAFGTRLRIIMPATRTPTIPSSVWQLLMLSTALEPTEGCGRGCTRTLCCMGETLTMCFGLRCARRPLSSPALWFSLYRLYRCTSSTSVPAHHSADPDRADFSLSDEAGPSGCRLALPCCMLGAETKLKQVKLLCQSNALYFVNRCIFTSGSSRSSDSRYSRF